MKIFFTKKFLKQVKKRNDLISLIDVKIRLFRNNPLHPGLKTEKLEPKYKNLYSFRLNKQWRIIFEKDKKIFSFLILSKHYE